MLRRASRVLAMAVACVAFAASSSLAQSEKTASKPRERRAASTFDLVNQGTVTVITDGITERSGLVTELASELASTVDEAGRLRLLPVMGYGAKASVRDLLYLRGIDLGIVNADVLEFLELEQQMPQAKRRLRYVTRLLDKTVFLAARDTVTAFDQLRGRTVLVIGKDSDAHVTARTVLALAGIEARLLFSDWSQVGTLLDRGEADAVLALDQSAADLDRRLGKDLGLNLLAIPLSPALARVYGSRTVSPEEAPDLVPAQGIVTLTVPTVLAVFNWSPNKSRFATVNVFVKSLFAALERLQAQPEPGLWDRVDPRIDVLGWERYEPIKPLIAALPPRKAPALQPIPLPRETLASLQSSGATMVDAIPPSAVGSTGLDISKVVAMAPATAARTMAEPVAKPAPLPKRLRIIASEQGGLVNERLPGQGLVVEVLLKKLAASRGSTDSVDTVEIGGDRAANLARLGRDPEISAVLVSGLPECARAGSASTEGICEGLLHTRPIFQVINGFFGKPDGPMFDADDSAIGRSICATADADLADLDANGRKWVQEERVTLIRLPTVEACFAELAKGGVEWVYTDELTGRAAISALDPTAGLRMCERPVSVTGYHLAVPRQRPNAEKLLASIDAALASAEGTDAIAALIATRLAPLIAN